MASSSHHAARELAHEFTPTLVEVFAVQRPKTRVAERRKRKAAKPQGMSRQAKALAIAGVVLLMVCAYAFGVLGRDTAVGLALQHAVHPPQPLPAPAPPAEPVIPLETIPIGEPWFSAPEVAPDAHAESGTPAAEPKVQKRRKR